MFKKLHVFNHVFFMLTILSFFLLFTWGCSTINELGQPNKCSSRAVELNAWKQIKMGLYKKGFSPRDFDLSFKNCEPHYEGGCSCDLVMSGKVCSDNDLVTLIEILNNVQGLEVGDVNFDKVKKVSFQEIEFHRSDDLTNFVNRNQKLKEGTDLYMGAFDTPAGRFDAYIRFSQGMIVPDIRYYDLPLEMIQIDKPLRPCFDYFTTLPYKEISPSLYQCDIMIEGFNNEDNIYLRYGNDWFLLGTWHLKEEGGQAMPSHLSGGSISGGTLNLPKKY